MWNRIIGKSGDVNNEASATKVRRNGDESRSTRPRSNSTTVSSNSNKKAPSRGDDRDRGFNPTSTSYSTTSRSLYPGTASASIASSYATASGKNDDEQYVPPSLERNASLAEQMPKSKSSRSGRDQDRDQDYRSERKKGDRKDGQNYNRDRGDQRRDLKDKSDKKDRDRAKDRGLSTSGNGVDEGVGSSRGPADFPNQVESAGFSQFPGQYDGGIPGTIPGVIPDPTNGTIHPAMSSHIQDQFPGQFPVQSAAPYRPPVAVSEGGPGLAAEYYGDAGESVAEQPGFRKHSPSLIIGAEPHLLPASAVANPPPEPSASGGVGAAASFFNGSFDESEAESTHALPASSTYTTAPSRPDNSHHSASAPAIPTVGAAAMGAAAGYLMGGQTSSHQPRPDQAQLGGGAQSEYAASTFQQASSQVEDSYYSEETRPSKPGKSSSHGPNIPMYAAGAAGAAGLAAAVYHQAHHSTPQHNSPASQYPATPMAQRHRHHGPLDAVVNFFRDPDGVAQFEEYSEIIGVCKYCFAPGSSPRDAPRKHYYRRRRSNERLGSSMRVDKDSRYYSSENERQRRKDKSWLASGLAGYGLGKMGETLFKQEDDFNDTYSVKTGRQSPEGRIHKPRRRSRSKERVETRVTSDDRIPRKDSHGGVLSSPTTMTYTGRRHSIQKSPERKSPITEAALGAAIGATMAGSTSRRRSDSPKGAWVKNIRKTREHSPERRRRSHKKKKERGFFDFINGSSSSSLDLTYSGNQGKRSNSRSTTSKQNDDKKAEAALLGLGAAAAALALKDSRQGHKKKRVKDLVGVKESRDAHGHDPKRDHKTGVSSVLEEDEAWESAPEDDQGSTNSDLAYGTHAHARRGSRESLSSESSGTDKWGWRWGSKKKHRNSPPGQRYSDHSTIPAMSGAAAAGLAGASIMSADPPVASAIDSASSLPLQQVYPVATSDPSRFDVGREGSMGSSSRPGIVPIQHPQPVTPVSAAIYSSQAPYEHSYSAPTGPPVVSQLPSQRHPPAVHVRSSQPDFSIPVESRQNSSQAKDDTEDFKLRRRSTSPARFNAVPVESEMTSARRPSAKDDIPAVRFDLTEEQEDRDRWERRQGRKEERQRRAAEEQEQINTERRTAMDTSKIADAKTDGKERSEKSSDKSWVVPAAAAGVGAAIGAAVVEDSKSDETREERKARRRRERELEEAADEEADRRRRRERRKRERELEREPSATKMSQKNPDDLNEKHQGIDREEKPSTKEKPAPQKGASPRRSSTHEDYGAFFAPNELLEKSNDKVKVTSANADADVALDRSSRVVTQPKGEREPVFSPADTDDKFDPSRLSFPWLVPRLRLVEPTPPSSRGATPVLRPKDASDDDIEEPPSIEELPDVEEPIKQVSTPRVTWGDAKTVEYTVITPHDEREEFIQSTPEQGRETEESSGRNETVSPHNRQTPPNGAARGNNSPSFGNDIEFAATLAATAEDAGFDPSIVINDPSYRRRESPPGSNERSMPGEFKDDDELPLGGKESKKRTRVNGRDDDAVVQDILSQVEYVEPEGSLSDPMEKVENAESSSKSGLKMTKKSRKFNDSRDESYENPQSKGRSQASYSRDFYESPTEDAQSSIPSVPGNRDVENGKKPRRRSKHDSTGSDDAASTVSAASALESSNDAASKSKEKLKKSLWSRVLGKPADSPSQGNGSKDLKSETPTEEIDGTKKKSERSKKRRSTRDEADDYDATSKSSGTSERSRRRQSSESSTARDSGRITQDLPAKVYTPAPYGHTMEEEMLTRSKERGSSRSTMVPDAGSVAQYLDLNDEPEQDNARMSESFLGMRPQPPPTPDIPDKEKEPPDPTVVAPPAAPPSLPDDSTKPAPVPVPPSPLQYPAALPSPTAVPINFRRPRSSGTPRSQSQTPLASTQSAPDISPRNKPRPRSTEFRGSEDMRPLWLVERHNSHQEQVAEETYPPLPSSHSTSRASSVQDVEEHNRSRLSDYEITKEGHEPLGQGRGLIVETESKAKELDLLDSQQATPTAASFKHSLVEGHSPSSARDSLHGPPMQDKHPHSSSVVEDAALGAVIGGSAIYALHKASRDEDLASQRLSEEENDQLQQNLKDKAPNSDPHKFHEDDRSSIQVLTGSEGKRSREDSSGVLGFADAVQQQHDEEHSPHDFALQRSTRFTGIGPEALENSNPIIGTDAVSYVESTEPEIFTPEDVRQTSEQASRDAVDVRSSPTFVEKDQKNEDEALFEKVQNVTEPRETTGETTGLLENHVESVEMSNSRKDDAVTKEMPLGGVIDMMTTIAQDEDLDLSPMETSVVRGQSQSESEDVHKVKRNPLLTEDVPSAEVTGLLTFVDQTSGNVPQSPQMEAATKESQTSTINKELVPKSPVYDISPEATPLPLDDDFDLLDALPPSPIRKEGNYEFGPKADSAVSLNKPLPQEEYRIHEQSSTSHSDVRNVQYVSPEATPLPLDDDLDLLDALPPSPIIQEGNYEFGPKADSAVSLNKPLPRGEYRMPEQFSTIHTDVRNVQETTDGPFSLFSENNETSTIDHSTIVKMQGNSGSPSAVPARTANSTGQIHDLEDDNLFHISEEELRAAENERPSVSDEQKYTTSKNSAQSIVDDSKSAHQVEAEEEIQLPAAIPDELKDNNFNNRDSNAVADVPPEGSRGVEDSRASFSSENQSKEGGKKESEIIDLEPGAFEEEPVVLQANSRELINEPAPSATTTTAQDVSKMLEEANDSGFVQPDADKLSTLEATQDIQEAEVRSPIHENLALTEEKTATDQADQLETYKASDIPQLDAGKIPPIVGSSTATVDTAKAVQAVLGGEQTTPPGPPRQDEAEVIPVVPEDPSNNQTKEIDEPEWGLSKDEKDSQARKSERFFLDETGYTDSMQSSTPPVEDELPLGLELNTAIAEKSSRKRSRKDKKSKKQPLSGTARDYQDDLGPDFTTIEPPQDVEQSAKVSITSFPTSAGDTLPNSVVEPSGPSEATPSPDSKDVSDVELPKEQGIPQARTNKEKRKSKNRKAFGRGEDGVRNLGYDRDSGAETPGENALTTTADIVGEESLEKPERTGSAPSDSKRDISEAVLSRGKGITIPKNKKDKRKSKKNRAFSWNENSAPMPGEEPTVEADEVDKDVLESTTATLQGEQLASTGAAEPTPSAGSKEISEAELPQRSNMAQSKNKKGKKKSKESKRFGWEDEATRTPLDDADAEDKDPFEETPERPTPPDTTMAESENLGASRSRSKKDRKKAKKGQALFMEGEGAPSLEKAIVQDPIDTVSQAPLAESNDDVPIAVRGSPSMGSRSETPLPQPIQNMSMGAPLEEVQTGLPALATSEHKSTASLVPAVRQADDLEDRIDDAYFNSNTKSESEGDMQEGNEARAPSWNVELQPHSREISEESATKGDSDTPTIIRLSDNPEMWSKQERLTEQIEPTEVVAPDDTPESRDLRRKDHEEYYSAQISDVGTLGEAGNVKELPVRRNSVKDGDSTHKKLQTPESEQDRLLPEAEEFLRVSTSEPKQEDVKSSEGRPREAVRTLEETKATQITGVAGPALEQEHLSHIPATEDIGNAIVEDEHVDVPVENGEKGKQQSSRALSSQNEAENVEDASMATMELSVASDEKTSLQNSIRNIEVTPSTDQADAVVAAETSVAPESPQHPKEYFEASSQAAEPSHSQQIDVANPVEEVEMMYAEDEFNNDNERPYSRKMHEIALPHTTMESPPSPAAEVEMMYAEDEFNHNNERPYDGQMQEIAHPLGTTELPPSLATEVEMLYAEDEFNHDNERPYNREMQEITLPHSGTESPPIPAAEVEMVPAEAELKHDNERPYNREMQEIALPHGAVEDPPSPAAEVEMVPAEAESNLDNERPSNREMQEIALPHSAVEGPPTPAAEVELMYAHDARDFADEQNREEALRRQQAPVKELELSAADCKAPDSQELRDRIDGDAKQHERYEIEHSPNYTKDPLTPVAEIETLSPEELQEHDKEDVQERELQDVEHLQSPTDDLPTNATEATTLTPPELRDDDQNYMQERERQANLPSQTLTDGLPSHIAKPEVSNTTELSPYEGHLMKEQDTEHFHSPPSDLPGDLPTPVAEVKMLDPQEQRAYEEEYAKEFERNSQNSTNGLPTQLAEPELTDTTELPRFEGHLMNEYDKQDTERPQSPTSDLPKDLPSPIAEIQMLDTQEQHVYKEERRPSPTSDLPTELPPPVAEVQKMLDPQEQHVYREERPQSATSILPTDLPTPLAEVQMLDAKEEQAYEDERPQSPTSDLPTYLPTSVAEVQMLAPQEQRAYKEDRQDPRSDLPTVLPIPIAEVDPQEQHASKEEHPQSPSSDLQKDLPTPIAEVDLQDQHAYNEERRPSYTSDLPTDLPARLAEVQTLVPHGQHIYKEEYAPSPILDLPTELPPPVTEVHVLDTHDQHVYKEEPPQSPTSDLPTPVAEVQTPVLHEQHTYKEERPDSPTSGLPTPVEEVQMLEPREQGTYKEERPQRPSSDLPTVLHTPVTEVDLQEQHAYKEEHPQSPSSDLPTDLPTPIAEVQMLDPQEQRAYEAEYAKELERQLSPAQNETLPYVLSGEASAPLTPASSVDTIMEPPYDIQRPLAQAPALEDIIEEPGSRSGSVQENAAPAAREDQLSSKPTKKSKKGKKGKKSKKQEQPVIWEDETATPPIEDETGPLVEPFTRSPNTLSSGENEELQQPIDLEEPIERRPVEQLVEAEWISPTRDLSSYRAPPEEHDKAGDYFSIQPTKGAEEDVDMDTTVIHEHPSSAELLAVEEEPRVGEPSPVQDERNLREHTYHNENDTPALEHASSDEQWKVKSTSADARADVDPSVAHSGRRSSNDDSKSKRSLGLLGEAPEPSPSSQLLEEPMYQPIRPDVSSLDSFSEMRASGESSLQRHPQHIAEPMATARERSRSQSRPSRAEGLAAAAGFGIGAIAAEGLSPIVSNKEGQRDNRRSGWEDLEETRSPERQISQAESITESQESGPKPEQQTSTVAQPGSLYTPSASPPPSIRHEPILSEPDSREAAHTLESFNVRDSGYMADSPILSDEVPVHRAIRDSGYPETESSPIIDAESHIQEPHSTREIQQDYGSVPTYLPVENDHEYQREEPPSSLPGQSISVPVEASPIPGALISNSKDRRRRRRSGASYDSDDSNDSGFDVQRRRRKQAMMDDVREPSPVSSTTKERSSELFGSSPSVRQERVEQPREYHHTLSHSEHVREEPTWSFDREVSPSPQARSRDASGETESTDSLDRDLDSPAYPKLPGSLEEPTRSLFGGPVSHDEDTMSRSMSPLSNDGRGLGRLNTIAEETSPLRKDTRAMSDVGSPEAGVQIRRMRSPPTDDDAGSYMSTEDRLSRQPGSTRDEHSVDLERSRSRHTDLSSRHSTVSHASIVSHKHPGGEERSASIASDKSIHAIIRTPDQVRSASGQSLKSSGTPPLRRVDRSVSSDLRGASKRSEAKTRAKTSEEDAELDINIPSSSTYDPVTDKGKSRADMADVYVSPHLDCPDDELIHEANLPKQEGWGDVRGESPMSPTRPPSMRKRQSMQLLEYETRLDQLVSENRLLQNQKTTAERTLEDQARDHSQQRHAYEEAIQEHKMFLAQKDLELNKLKGVLDEWQSQVTHLTEVNEALNSRGLDEEHEERYRQLEAEHTNLREQHTHLSQGMEEIVRHEVSVALEEKNLELRQLRDELENAKQQVRTLQQQLLASRSSEDFIERDEDYFDSQCQSLCQHVQQWVLRFSKFSDMKACYHPSEIRDEKIVDRVENAILDGTDVDEYLQDRVKRRDVFMSVVMTMIWEFIFTRYLFGMDREQRQKLKNLEKTLQEVGPISAVHKWRATTLTLLMKRPSFERQRATDTEAVVQEIYDTLATFLPPPSHLVKQIQESLRKVINAAVDLSIEMRTQRAEYSMLPPLQPEYDTNGDLARKVYFSALTMNERSGQTSSNEALQEQRAVVRMVLFPLVVKNEDDDEQIVVCPAQVLVADSTRGKGKSVRVSSGGQGARSEASLAATDVNMEGGMI